MVNLPYDMCTCRGADCDVVLVPGGRCAVKIVY